MMNALCMLCLLLDVDNLRDIGALADGIIMSGCFGVCDVWDNLNELTTSKGCSTQAAYLG